MNKRIRAAALSAIAVVAAGLLNFTTSSPANAAEGKTCMDPVITGSIARVVGESQTPWKPVYAEFTQSGYTNGFCPTFFTDYRYRVTFTYDGRTVAAYNTSLEPVYGYQSGRWTRTGTRIVFPTLRLSWDGYQTVKLAVTSGSKLASSSYWCRSNEETYDSTILTDSWGGYDTTTGVPRARINACP